jgi:Ca2+/H+ antiporter, TMEM165/GDT1 family
MLSFFSSLFFIALAEMADKTQFLALSFAAKYKTEQVLAGVFAGTLIVQLLAVLVGKQISLLVPLEYLELAVGISFIGFGFWTLRGEREESADEFKFKFGPVMTIALAFFIAELGDKTQLATVSLAAEYRNFWGVWLGSTSGMLLADAGAIWFGAVAHKKLPKRMLETVSAVIFIMFGLAVLYDTIKQ